MGKGAKWGMTQKRACERGGSRGGGDWMARGKEKEEEEEADL